MMKDTFVRTLVFGNPLLLATLSVHIALAQNVAPIYEVRPNPKPKPCLPEGKRSNDPGRCCSRSASGNICCGETNGSCAVSRCCDPAGDTPHCHQGSCVSCFPEGAQGDATSCCDHVASNGICCGAAFGTCATSGCCAEDSAPYCHEDVCVPCLPEGALGDEESCCSQSTTESGRCCGEVGGPCAQTGCCAAGAECDAALTCHPCLEEGSAVTDPANCCSGTAENGICCGLLNDSCATSGCCLLGVCSDSTCIECLPEGQGSSDSEVCCSHEASNGVCCGEENGFCLDSGCCAGGQNCFQFHCQNCQLAGAACTSQLDCCEGDCCDGTCTPTDSDLHNCGGCGNECAGICCGGQCIPECSPGQNFDFDICACDVPCNDIGTPGCNIEGDCCPGHTCCNGICTDTATDPSNCGGCANNCPTLFGGQGPNTCQNGICGHQCTWPSNSPCPPPADLLFCQFFETCVQSCLINGRGEIVAPPYVICCSSNNCGDRAPATCGDGVCCCGGCDLATLTCCGSIGDSCATDADCCPGMVCDEAFGGCNSPN